MPHDPILANRIREVLTEMGVEFEAKLIMGILCFRVNGTMCAGVLDQQLIVRIDPADESTALAKPNCKPMYFTGRPMKDFMFIDPNGTRTREQVLEWLEFALKVNREQSASGRRRTAEAEAVGQEELPERSSNSEPGRSSACQ
jgi:TfoX/Sxy family transcriptional regulator of competence genes